MTSLARAAVDLHCACGDSMKGESDETSVAKLQKFWTELHVGEGHARVTEDEARAVRRAKGIDDWEED